MAGTTFAAILAQHYIARHGYVPATVPEAEALKGACDAVLTLADGLSFRILCIVDRQSRPARRFGLPPEDVRRIGRECLPYAGRMNGASLPVVIRIVEVGLDTPPPEDRRRLAAYRRAHPFSKVHLTAWALTPSDASLWTNAAFGGVLAGRHDLLRLMREPGGSDARPQVLLPRRFPVVAAALVAALAAIFALEQVFAVEPGGTLLTPGIRTLLALGGLNAEFAIERGQWYRVFSAAALHGGLLHLLLNAIVLYYAGTVLERLAGRWWFAALFVIGTLGGSLMSLAVNPPTMVSVGASGAIMGLLAAAFILHYRLPPGPERGRTKINLMQVLIPALIPLSHSPSGQAVDFAAHFGGALAGAATAWGLTRIWPAERPVPGWRGLAAAIALAGLCGFAYAGWTLAGDHRSYALSIHLIPSDQLPQSEAEGTARSADLLTRYPRDPRSHWYRARAHLAAKDDFRAEMELRAALEDEEMLTLFGPPMEWRLRTLLALVVLPRRPGEAREIAQPVCRADAPPYIRAALAEQRLCE